MIGFTNGQMSFGIGNGDGLDPVLLIGSRNDLLVPSFNVVEYNVVATGVDDSAVVHEQYVGLDISTKSKCISEN